MGSLARLLVGALGASMVLACAPRVPTTPRSPVGRPEGAVRLPAKQASPAAGASVERLYELAGRPDAPVLGGSDAKVTLEVCSDFECPYCARLAPVLHELNENYGELVKIVWRDCPLPSHAHALVAAEAASEVHAQRGDAAFWAYHDRIFAHQHELSEAMLITLSGDIEGVDTDRLRQALRDGRHQPRIKAQLISLVEAGAAPEGLATPVTFINGRMFTGALPYRDFEDAVERALQEQPGDRARAESDSKDAYPMARARHILVQYRGAQGAAASIVRSREEARARAIALRQRVALEHDFEAIARAESDCPSGKDGGKLGRFTRGELEEQFDQALFMLSAGEVSEAVETPFGFHVILREE